MIYTFGDDIHNCVVMICQACGLDKKIRCFRIGFFGGEGEIRTLAPLFATYTLSRGASSAYLSTSPYARAIIAQILPLCKGFLQMKSFNFL